MKTNKILAVIFFIFFLAFFVQSNTLAQIFYVSWNAEGGGDGTPENPYTIQEAVDHARPGYTFNCDFGGYYNFSYNPIIFNQSGTINSPIKWIGTIDVNDFEAPDANGTVSTVFYNGDNPDPNLDSPIITISGSYQEFHNIIFKQGQPGYFIRIDGNHVTFDHIATKYTSTTGSDSRHLAIVYGNTFTLRNSHIYQSPRTAFWIRWNTTAPNNVLFEGNIWTGHSHHPAFQIMPSTDVVRPEPIRGVIIRNETFIDNSFGDLFYLRHTIGSKIYNCLSINSGMWSLTQHPVSPRDTTTGILIAFNTIISNSTTFSPFYDEATQNVKYLNNIIYSTQNFNSHWLFRFDKPIGSPFPPVLRHNFDYNTYYNSSYGDDFGTIAKVKWYRITGTPLPVTLVYNDWRGLGFDAHSTHTSMPDFTDPSNGIYTLNTNITGIPISGITTDKNGNPRNASTPSRGCYEYQGGGDQKMKKGLELSRINGHLLPEEYSLEQNFPNPFNPSTIISYKLPVSGYVTLKVLDVIGNEVATLVDEYRDAGSYEVEFNTSSINHHPSSGVYFYQLKAGAFVETKKMLLVK